MTPQERLDYLLEIVEEPNYKGWQSGELPTALQSLEDANTLLGIIEQASPLTRSAFIALSLPTGLQLWDKGPLLDALPIPDELREKVKALGVIRRPRWEIEGRGSEPTLAEVESLIAAEQLQELRDNLQTQFDTIKNQIGTSEQSEAVAALRAMADELEA